MYCWSDLISLTLTETSIYFKSAKDSLEPQTVILDSLATIDLIAYPKATVPFGTILIGTSLEGDFITTSALNVSGTISTSTISPFSS